MKKLFIFLILFFSTINVKAYENEYFLIDIPNGYKESLLEDTVYKWEKDNSYIAITLGLNVASKYNIKNFTEEDIENQKEYLENNISQGLEEYNINVSVPRIEKINEEDNYYLEYDIYYPSNKLYGYDTYQRGRMYTTKNYIVTIIYSGDKEINEIEEYSTMINSLKIKDDSIKSINYRIYFIIMIILGVTLGIIGYIKDNKKRN